MLLGIFSDVHDQLANLQAALDDFTARGIDTLLFCGDFCSPIPARAMSSFGGTIHAVFGNGDGDRFAMQRLAETSAPNLKLYGEYAELDLGGAALALTHYPFYARALARTGDYQAVFSGHTHAPHEERLGGCLWINPGEVLGWKGPPSVAVYDTEAHTSEFILL